MICRECKREIPENSIYCNWCGAKQLRERRKKQDIRVPAPKQLPSGSWNIYLRAEKQSVTEATEALCLARARAIRAGLVEQKKDAAARGLTLREAIDNHIALYAASLSPSTKRGYDMIKKHRFPGKIDQPLAATAGWQSEIDRARAEYAAKTVKNAWGLVATVMRENAVPVPDVRIPRKKAAPLPWLTHTQVLAFLDAVQGRRCETAALLALHSLRLSEIFALTWDDLDLDRQRVTVHRARVRDQDGRWVQRDATKTEESTRTIRMMIPALPERLAELKAAGLPPVLCAQSSLTESINRVCARAGLPECGTHGLRRSFASLAYHLGMSELETMEIGGWSDPAVMHAVYIQLAAEDRLAAENRMESFYRAHTSAPESTQNADKNTDTAKKP